VVAAEEPEQPAGGDEQFRSELRAWLAEHAPPAVEHGDAAVWQRELVDAGYAMVTWPAGLGGRSGSSRQQAIVAEELAAYDLPVANVSVIGTSMTAPTILAHGTDEQKAQWLLPLIRGEHQWCQLFSEPGAGSDLAGLTTRAERDGDEWVVNGQKVWSTFAHLADFGILLARTDADQPKHRGITYFLIDMHQPGIEVRPLRQMTGGAEFNEVFLTDARVPHENVLGVVNGGWGVAMTTLAHERSLMGSLRGGRGRRRDGDADEDAPRPVVGTDALIELAREYGKSDDPLIRQRLADAWSRDEIARYLVMRVQAAAARGRIPDAEMSIMKLMAAKQAKRVAELALAIEGPLATLIGDDAPRRGSWQGRFLSAPSLRIAGGSDQVQRNVIGERTLGLPAEPRVDKDVPFRDVPKNPTRV
jgi:alkylation response protein AidB-like acyl-CoA dehydrogenase